MNADLVLTPELRLLTYSAFLCLLLWMPYTVTGLIKRGVKGVAGYPTGIYSDLPELGQRAQRAHMNLIENLAPFAALVIVAHLTGAANEATLLGARLFFWARIVQAAVHIAGVPGVRTVAFVVGWIGNLIIFWEILT